MNTHTKKENRRLRMPKKFADMTEEETEYGGGTAWKVVGWTLGCCAFASAIGAGVTGYLWHDTGSSEMKKYCICCIIGTVSLAVLSRVSFAADSYLLRKQAIKETLEGETNYEV